EGTKLVDAHEYASAWNSDDDTHWHACPCGAKKDVGAHVDEDANARCDVCSRAAAGYEELKAFENAVAALASLENASLSAKYEALYAAALAFAQIEDKDTALASEAYADYLAFAQGYNEAASAISSDIPKPF
ncbi:MAG: hypothetical protein J6V82_04810, partial [Clostridia bacterium]|nr:hypothetical protein [Clostridia bacterium]